MEIKKLAKNITEWTKKYKIILLTVIIGLLLMMIPGGNKENKVTVSEKASDALPQRSLEEELSEILQHIKGVGNTKVLLTVAEGEETIYQTNHAQSTGSESTKDDTDTVTITDANRNQYGLIRQTNPPVYMGAIIICQGADDPTVKLSVTEAVAKITGLKTNQISVLKMK